MKYDELRKKYPQFVYENYSYKISGDNLEIVFYFSIREQKQKTESKEQRTAFTFSPKIITENVNKKRVAKIGERVLGNLVFHLGLMEIPSYWKATCSPEIIIQAGYLNREQIKWWHDLIINGMGQYFYENKINFRQPNFLKITCKSNHCKKATIVAFLQRSIFQKKLKKRTIIPVGGGKDSIVTLESLKKRKRPLRCFLVNPKRPALETVKISGIKNPIIVRREIDRRLLSPNNRGYLNGHTPFTAVLSFLSIFCAVLFDYKQIAFSNEKSTEEGNVQYLGKEINHQWSKTWEFEKKFRFYSKKYLARDVHYFSFLRSFSEIKIAKTFSQYPQYFKVFVGCNNAYKISSKINRWCGQCAKCLFIFLILYPFLEEKTLNQIFGENLLDKKDLLPTLKALIGLTKVKPFECVGTRKESLAAFNLCKIKTRKENKQFFLLNCY